MKRKAKSLKLKREPKIGTHIITRDDGSIGILLADHAGKPSWGLRYSSRSGRLEKTDKFPFTWIGEIRVAPNFAHRAWSTVTNFMADWKIPTEIPALEKFIADRGDRAWYRIQMTGVKRQKLIAGVYLPGLLRLAKATEAYDPKEKIGIVSHVAVAPRWQHKGYGATLHFVAASHLKSEGYSTLTSDVVGLNTAGELAVWKSLAKEFRVTPLDESFALGEYLQDAGVIDASMRTYLDEHSGTYVDKKVMTGREIASTKFPQFQMDLTDDRIPMLMKKAA